MLRRVIDGWLLDDREAPRKQRHTARRIHRRLVEEYGFQGAESTVRLYVRGRRRGMGIVRDTHVPRDHAPGQEAEVDWYEAEVDFPEGRQTVQFFEMRACFSGREFHMGFPRQTQQAFLEGHAEAFAYFGGIFPRIRYDNLKAAVKKLLQGRRRQEQDRFVAMRSHYLFESEFCRPGVDGAPEKGGVENGVGRFRRNHLVPVLKATDFDDLNRQLRESCARDDLRRMERRTATVIADWEQESPHLRPLPAEPFDTVETSTARVDGMGRVRVRTNWYSVPIGLAHLSVEVRVRATRVVIVYGGKVVGEHERLQLKNAEHLKLEHYLDLLWHKPGALAASRPLRQARDRGELPPDFDRLWQALRERHGEAEGTRQLIGVMLLYRNADREAVTSAVGLALSYGCYDAGAIATLLRQLQAADRRVEPLRDLGSLAQYERPTGDLSEYDLLLQQAAC
jgi:transposase